MAKKAGEDRELFLLAKVKEDPENDLPRLALADWLQKQGESDRPAFIRASCELARLHEHDPRREHLQHEVNRTSSSLRTPAVGRVLQRNVWTVDRGMVRIACLLSVLAHRNLEEAAAAEPLGWAWVDGVSISELVGGSPELVPEWPLLADLNQLGLFIRGLTRTHLAALASSPRVGRLTDLLVSESSLGTEGAQALASGPLPRQLTRLTLGIGLGPAGMEVLMTVSMPRLQRLTLDGNELGPEGAVALAAARWLRGLTHLSLAGCQIGDVGAQSLATSALSKVVSLNLSDNEIGDEGAAALASAPWLFNVTDLNLANNAIGNAGAAALASSPALSGLRELNLANNRLREPGQRALLSSPSFGGLFYLGLRGNRVGSRAGTRLRNRFAERVEF